MMKKYIFLIFFVSVLLFVAYRLPKENKKKPIVLKQELQQQSVSPTKVIQKQKSGKEQKGINVPYWSIAENTFISGYDSIYYFGIQPTAEGTIQTDEEGYRRLSFLTSQFEQTSIVIRMIDPTIYESLLSQEKVGKQLSQALVELVTKKNLRGVILDLEVSYTFQPEKKEQITKLVQTICAPLQSHNKLCGMFLYGDTQYRKRPYDIQKLGKIVDRLFIMAYDFHLAGGEPGPNFSFSQLKTYGYDFKQMISDITSLVSEEKIEIVFGMYGYDWTLNEQGTPLKAAQVVTVKNLKLKVEDMKKVSSFKLQVTKNSDLEKKITYIDEQGRNHVIWYEDEESAELKMQYAREMGITQFSFWAYSYF